MGSAAGFRPETEEWLAGAPLERRKRFGQFFTPQPVCDALLEPLARAGLPAGARILDPACGSGEFLLAARRWFPQARLAGLEIDPGLAAVARRIVPDADVRCADALELPAVPDFDLVVGNPPYFERRVDAALRTRFGAVLHGRSNSYALFLALGLDWLRDGGRLAFVVPPSMNNGAYFRKLREHVAAVSRIESLTILEDPELFDGAQQSVMLLTLRKGGGADSSHVFRRGPFTLFAEDPAALAALFDGAATLDALGFTVRTGTVVWNQARADLTDDPRGAVRLIWSRDVGDGALDFRARPGRPSWVRGRAPLHGPAIVVNRVVGRVGRGRLRVATIPLGMPFVGENHVNVVLPPPGLRDDGVARVAAALREPRALAAVRLLTGNTQLSAVELQHLVPLRLQAPWERRSAPRPAGPTAPGRRR